MKPVAPKPNDFSTATPFALNGTAAKPLAVFEQLRALRTVPENWDGYGGAATRADAIDGAIAFLHELAHYDVGCRVLPHTIASPTRTGGVLLEWENGPHQLEVEIEGTGKISGAYLNTESDEGENLLAGPMFSSRFFELAEKISIFPASTV